MLMRSPIWRIAFCLTFAAALLSGPAFAAESRNGSKNFDVPTSVPNYFSNEAGPMIGGATETRRGPLYSSQSYAGAAQPVARAATARVAPLPARQHIAMAEPRGRALRGRHAEAANVHRGASANIHHAVAHGRAPMHLAVRRRAEHVRVVHAAHAGRRTEHAARRTVHAAAGHRHARG
jgi:hypothetical protein